MMLLRAVRGLAVLVCLGLSHSGVLHAQINVSAATPMLSLPAINEPVTRVPISIEADVRSFGIEASVGPGIFICLGPQDSSFSPETMKLGLYRAVEGKSAAQLRGLIQQIALETNRIQKLILVLSLPADAFHAIQPQALPSDASAVSGTSSGATQSTAQGSSPAGPGSAAVNHFRGHYVEGASLAQLRMGREITITAAGMCTTVGQVDQIIAEGLRVMQTVLQQLAPGTPASAAGPPVKPGAIQQQLNR